MENLKLKQEAQTLSPSSSGRRSSACNSPDFQFWMVRNPSFPQPNLASADELFVNGILLPLHLHPDPPDTERPSATSKQGPPVRDSGPEPRPGPELSAVTHESTPSKRWKDFLFKKGSTTDKKAQEDKAKEKKKERKGQKRTSSAELNINIWPFSRSRSAGNNGSRPRMVPGAPGTRKVSSAPCSRSNSSGESKCRKLPSSPSRAGVHLGRSSPVWQVRRKSSSLNPSEPVVRNAEKGVQKEVLESCRSKTPAVSSAASGGGAKAAKVLNLSVPMCISYRHHLSCRSDENGAITGGGAIGNGGGKSGGGTHSGGSGGGGGNLFNLRSLFTKKVY